MEDSHQECDKKEGRNSPRREDKESMDNKEADNMQDEENLPNDEEAASYIPIQQFLYNNFPPTSRAGAAPLRTEDEVAMTTVVTTESADKGGSEQNARASSEEELTLDEAADITTTEVKKTEDDTKDEPTASTGEEKGRTEVKEGTADQAGTPDGGAPL